MTEYPQKDLEETLGEVDKLIDSDHLDSARQILTDIIEVGTTDARVYLRLSRLDYAQHNDEQAEKWAQIGLSLEKNNGGLWEILVSIWMNQGQEFAIRNCQALADKHKSFAGFSLAAHIEGSENEETKLRYLKSLFESGLRDLDFLVEYTALLGVNRQFEAIPPILFQTQLTHSYIPWQLYAHTAQAYLAMEKTEDVKPIMATLESIPEVPQEVLTDLKSTYEEKEVKSPVT